MAENNNVTGWVGWVYFAGAFMVLAGVFQAIVGFMALLQNQVFVVTPERLVLLNYTAWGWVHLALGAIVLTAGVSVLNGGTWGRVVGTFLTALSLIANFVFIAAYPFWSITLMVVDVLVLYALLVHGGEAREA